MQVSMTALLPSIFLSGYIFPRNTMPLIFWLISYLVPATYMIEISRGIILRGAGFLDVWHKALVLLIFGILVLAIAARRFRKMVS